MVILMRNHIAAASLLMLLMTAFAVVASAQGAKATDVKVSMPAGLLDYRGRCPVDIPITGSIQATGLGLIKYQFVHSSGASGPVQRLISIGSRQ